jgi:hypothetical protein
MRSDRQKKKNEQFVGEEKKIHAVLATIVEEQVR